MKEVTSLEELYALIKQNRESGRPLFLFKHSTACNLSSTVFLEFERFAENHPEADCHYIDLWAHRDVCDALTDISEIRHQSPQVLLYRDGALIWNASHRDISSETLQQQSHS